jgi:SAM-dependent methyltransferase
LNVGNRIVPLAALLSVPIVAIFRGVLQMAMLFGLRTVATKRWIDVIALALVFSLFALGAENPWLEIPFALISGVLFAVATVYLGLLSLVASWAVFVLLSAMPIGYGFSQWFSPYVWITLVIVGMIVAFMGARRPSAIRRARAGNVMSNPFATEEMAAGYAAARPPVHPRVLAEYFAQRESGRVEMAVDLGCGAGLSTRALVPYASRVLGLEPAVLMLRLARGFVPGAVFAAAAGEALPLRPGSVDLVTAAGSLNYVRDLDRCFDEMRRVLRPDGSVLVYDFGAGRRFNSRDELNGWFETFVTRYPYPASEARPLDPDILAALAHGFDIRSQSPFVIGLAMARPAYRPTSSLKRMSPPRSATARRSRGFLRGSRLPRGILGRRHVKCCSKAIGRSCRSPPRRTLERRSHEHTQI